MRNGMAVASGLGLGAGLVYLLDPEQGRRRRARARDAALRFGHTMADALDTTARDVRNRLQGAGAMARSSLAAEPPTDDVLAERVRARLGRLVSHPGSIEVVPSDGHVTLHGPVLAREVKRLMAGVFGVRGVKSIDNQLEVHETAANVPGLQGEPGRRRESAAPTSFLHANWSPAARLLAVAGGTGAFVWAVRRGGFLGAGLATAGVALAVRGATNMELKRLVGLGAGRRAVDIRKTVNIDAPIEKVFEVWNSFENYPRFMEHVCEVRRTGPELLHWVVAGPVGAPVEYDTVITSFVPNELVAWKTVDGSIVQHAGIVRFFDNAGGGCRVEVRMSYNPPAGAVGHGVASILGVDPKHALDDDMLRLKSLLEEGRTRAHGEAVTETEIASGARGTQAPARTTRSRIRTQEPRPLTP